MVDRLINHLVDRLVDHMVNRVVNRLVETVSLYVLPLRCICDSMSVR